MTRRRFYKIVFAFAGLYNIGWGIFSSIYPQWFFKFAGIGSMTHPEVYVCLAMVVGIYGLLYLEVARVPERGWPIAAVGLLGKGLGPIGALYLIIQGQWPLKAFWLCVTNDLIWWIPFSIYLMDSYRKIFNKPPD